MQRKFEQTQKQLGGNNPIMDQWLHDRGKLIKNYCDLVQFSIIHIDGFFTNKEILPFCDNLIDYLSTGHFKLYNRLMNDWDKIGYTPTQEMNLHYCALKETTDKLLTFYDAYLNKIEDIKGSELANDVEKLGKELEQRFDIEDCLIKLILETFASYQKTSS